MCFVDKTQAFQIAELQIIDNDLEDLKRKSINAKA
jgi:hypothetical protein